MGWGVYATKKFLPGEIIETCPAKPLTKAEINHIDHTCLDYWFFEWKKNREALLFGYGMLYNHSSRPNAAYFYNYPKNTVTFIASQTISVGRQILINYNQYGHHSQNLIPMFHPQTKKYYHHKST